MRAAPIPWRERVVALERRELKHRRELGDHLAGPRRTRHATESSDLTLITRAEYRQTCQMIAQLARQEGAFEFGQDGRPSEVFVWRSDHCSYV